MTSGAATAADAELTSWPAHRLATAVRAGTVTSVDVATAFLDRIDALEPVHHAFTSRRTRDDVLKEAEERDDSRSSGVPDGWLYGVPTAVKDLTDVRGLPTTLGFWHPGEAPVATGDEDFVPRLRATGCLVLGKTSTPELGLGSHTYSRVAETTRNAFVPDRSAGGSSGGAAVAVATGMVPVADGSDFMGSLRNPPGWNGVFGLRPTAERSPTPDGVDVQGDGGVTGPVARDAVDLAHMLATLTGRSLPTRGADSRLRRIGWLGDLDGELPTEQGLLDVCRASLAVFADAGTLVEDAPPPLGPGFEQVELLWPTWLTFRHAAAGAELSAFADEHDVLDRMKPEAQWEVAGYRSLTDEQQVDMARRRHGLARVFSRLFDWFDALVLPTAQVFPFPADQHWPTEIAGRSMDTYHRWMEVTAPATLAGLPVLAVPVPTSGLPIGLQVIGPPNSEPMLLAVADVWQRAVAGSNGVALCRTDDREVRR